MEIEDTLSIGGLYDIDVKADVNPSKQKEVVELASFGEMADYGDYVEHVRFVEKAVPDDVEITEVLVGGYETGREFLQWVVRSDAFDESEHTLMEELQSIIANRYNDGVYE